MPYNEGVKAFTSGEALATRRRVKKSSGTVVYSDADEDYIGVTEHACASGDVVSVKLKNCAGTFEMTAAGAISVNTHVHPADDGKVDDAVAGPVIGYALEAATADGDIIEVLPIPTEIISAQKVLEFNLLAAAEADGTVLAAFADGASNTPGISVTDSECFGIRWNNAAAPDPIVVSAVIPPDLDETQDVTIHILASKTGATSGDAVTWLVGCFFLVDAALHDADTDCGGTSSAMTGDATAKTLQEETLTIAAANVQSAPGVITLTVQPTDGTLGTDDVIISGIWAEYTGKTLTS